MFTAPAPTQPVTLHSLRDTVRPVLIFAPTAADPSLLKQLHLLAAQVPGLDLEDRQVRIFVVTQHPSPTQPRLADSPDLLRRRFHIAPANFTVILLGKDGGEKLRTTQPLPWPHLRDTIDAMPMRQQEVRQK